MPVRDLLSAASTQGAAPSDPYFYDVSLLLNGDGTNGAQNNTFLDSSTNNFTITRNGNTTQGSFSPYGNLWSNYLPASSYLRSASNIALGSTYTFEAWVNFSSLSTGGSAENSVFGSGAGQGIDFGYGGSTGTRWYMAIYGAGFTVESANTTVTLNTWYHVAWVKNGTTGTIYVNGTQVATGTYNPSSPPTTGISIGSYGSGGTVNGYISNARYVSGTAVYTSNFTPSTTPLTAISGTVFLTCQSNRFVDNSSNNYTFNLNGTPQVTRFSPFNPTAPYSTTTIGGSGYFGGSGDFLNFASGSISSGANFTVEFWVYPTAFPSGANQGIFALGDDRFGVICTSSSGNIYVLANSGDINTGTNMKLNAWNHIALSRNSGTLYVYLNGVSIGNASNTDSISGNWRVAKDQSDTQTFNCYMSNARIVSGTGLYPSGTTFTPPTSPETAISGTQVLLNFTNAGIPDLAMQNDLQTVGSAQVSTSVKKYGTGSLAFDGSTAYLLAPSLPVYGLGTGNFTIEAWVYPTASQTDNWIVAFNLNCWLRVGASGKLSFYDGVGSNEVLAPSALSLNTWTYVSVTRSGSTVTLYQNGSSVASGTISSNFGSSSSFSVGGVSGYSRYWNGYIDDVRITNGLARTITTPTAALPTY